MLEEGWYLMSPAELEAELPYLNDPSKEGPVGSGIPLDREAALAYKHAGNRPDESGRWLRLVLRADGSDPGSIARRRLLFEPDYHEAPSWRGPDSKPVNVIPLRERKETAPRDAWWEDPAMAALEAEWQRQGTAGGVHVPGAYRSFIFKTIISLRAAGLEVSPTAIADSVSRWVPEHDAAKIRAALLAEDPER